MYSIPYIVILFMYYIASLKFSINEKRIIKHFIAFFLFFIFVAFRGYVGFDVRNYYTLYQNLPTLKSFRTFSTLRKYYGDVEFGFIAWMSFVKTLHGGYLVWQFFNTCVNILLLSIILKENNESNYGLFFVLFFTFGGIAYEFEALRNAKAIYLFVLSTKYIWDRKFIKYTLLNLFGMLFHISSILYIPFYFIANKRPRKIMMLCLFFIGYVILLAKISVFETFLKLFAVLHGGRFEILAARYLATQNYYVSIFGTAERFITFLLLYKFQNRIYKEKGNYIAINAMYVYLLIFLYFSSVSIIAERVSLLFIFSYWFIYPIFYKCIKEHGVFIMLLILYTVFKFYSAYGNRPIMLYENIFIGIMGLNDKIRYANQF